MKTWKQALFAKAYQIHRIIGFWIFTDVIYAILPLVVIALLTGLLGRGFKEFLLLKEWSFASIVLYGVAIRKTIKLKTAVQRIPRSWTLDIAVQAVIPWFIGAVLVLSVVILIDMGVVARSVSAPIAVAQLVFFLVASAFVLGTIWAEESLTDREDELPNHLPRAWVMKRVSYRLDDISDELVYVVYALQRLCAEVYRSDPDLVWARLQEEERIAKLENSVLQTERLVERLRRHIDSLRQLDQCATGAATHAASGAQ